MNYVYHSTFHNHEIYMLDTKDSYDAIEINSSAKYVMYPEGMSPIEERISPVYQDNNIKYLRYMAL